MRTRKETWRVNQESLEEKAKAIMTARVIPSIKNAAFSVLHVGP